MGISHDASTLREAFAETVRSASSPSELEFGAIRVRDLTDERKALLDELLDLVAADIRGDLSDYVRDSQDQGPAILRIFQLLFLVGEKAEWKPGVREGSLGSIRLLVDEFKEYSEAEAWIERILPTVVESQDLELLQIVLGDAGLAYTYGRNLLSALLHLSAAIDLARLQNDRAMEAKYLGDLGAAFARTENLEAAEAHLVWALKIGNDIEEFPYLGKFEEDLRNIHMALAGAAERHVDRPERE